MLGQIRKRNSKKEKHNLPVRCPYDFFVLLTYIEIKYILATELRM